MNPEFQRNLWLEFSTQRLIAMPVILFSTFCLAYLLGDLQTSKQAAFIVLILLVVVWGAGLAANAIFQEIEDRTWDTQRMTPLGPWNMTWGKLLGSTLYVWYGALFCLVAIVAVSFKTTQSHDTLFKIGYYLLTGLFTQAFALFLALLIQCISPLRNHFKIVLIQIVAVTMGLTFFYMGYFFLPTIIEKLSWYYFNVDPQIFVLSSQCFFIVWLIIGIYRLLQTELQVRTIPWVWPLFAISLCIYGIGFVAAKPIPDVNMSVFYSGIAYLIFVPMTFITAFFTPKSLVTLKRTLLASKTFRVQRLLFVMPPWIIGLIIILMLGLTTIILLPSVPFEKLPFSGSVLQLRYAVTGFIISLFWFLLRDIGILYFMTLYPQTKRAHLATAVYLAFLYTILPMLLSFSSMLPHFLQYAFAPWAWFTSLDYLAQDGSSFISLTTMIEMTSLVLIQAILAWMAVFLRSRFIHKQSPIAV